MARKIKTMDGNTAAAHVSYAFTDVASIYPITPSSVMAELSDKWSAAGRKNIFGQEVKVVEMQSEAGAAGAVHGSLAAGALTTTFTASQGLLLMIPNMYKIAGELLPGVIHCSARALASHALSIFGDHSDVMACRQTGFAMLASTNPQEVMDLGAVAHLAAIEGRVPFLHFFDGFRTSHEMQKIEVWDYDNLEKLLNKEAVESFRKNSLNPEHPVLRGTAQNPDIFFQAREASNIYYNKIPDIVEKYMNAVNAEIGSDYKLFNYYGAADAEHIIVAMGSACDAIEETIDYLNANGEKLGLVKVRLYRPWVAEKFIDALPGSVKSIAVLDRTKEPGALGEPLYLDVVASLKDTKYANVKVAGGRYGLGSKDFSPACVAATYRNIQSNDTKNPFTVGIEDDINNISLPLTEKIDTTPKGIVSCKFWGLGADGTVGANKNSIKIIGDHTDLKVQAYFAYDSKKSGGITVSHLRFGSAPIKSTYFISQADFVACHNPSYVDKYDMVQDLKPNGTFLLNCGWDVSELSEKLPGDVKAFIAKNNIKLYTVDGISIARDIGLGGRINMILQSAFFKLSNIIPIDDAVKYMKQAVIDTYGRKGEKVVNMNHQAIDAGIANLIEVKVPSDWANATGSIKYSTPETDREELFDYVNKIMLPVNAQRGDSLPVSAFSGAEDGTVPQGAAAFEKRGVAIDVPEWIPENCIQCNQCSLVCPHAAIRPYALSEDELKKAPEGYRAVKMNGKGTENLHFALNVSVLDCLGCGVCAGTCPAKNKALVMKNLDSQRNEQANFDYADKNVAPKEIPLSKNTVKGSQFEQPYLEFSGACAGCGETPYAKLITQMFGDRMYIANATGCSSIWGGSAPSTPYTVNKQGKGPAWANSLFEDNAEFGMGMQLAVEQRRNKLSDTIKNLADTTDNAALKDACNEWLENKDNAEGSKAASDKLLASIGSCGCEECREIVSNKDMLIKKSIWIFGGDGWAYDIGFGGVDHAIASGRDINIFVFDTEVYSNTGGQASKSSQIGQVAQFAASGKDIAKKSLGEIAMTYGYVYVAQIAMGANQAQCIKAIAEAEAYPGPSIIIAYAPCINHGIKGGLINAQSETKRAVESGYWHLYRFDPRLKEQGKNPFQLDSKAPTMSYKDFINNETRYTTLKLQFPERAEDLFDKAEAAAKDRYEHLLRLSKLYE